MVIAQRVDIVLTDHTDTDGARRDVRMAGGDADRNRPRKTLSGGGLRLSIPLRLLPLVPRAMSEAHDFTGNFDQHRNAVQVFGESCHSWLIGVNLYNRASVARDPDSGALDAWERQEVLGMALLRGGGSFKTRRDQRWLGVGKGHR